MLRDKINNYSRTKICEELKISRSTLNNWEKYETENIFKYLTLCEMLGVNPFDELENFRKIQENKNKNSTN